MTDMYLTIQIQHKAVVYFTLNFHPKKESTALTTAASAFYHGTTPPHAGRVAYITYTRYISTIDSLMCQTPMGHGDCHELRAGDRPVCLNGLYVYS
jgi:hypothetical protein